MNKQAECVRDYKRYLSSEPTPSDYSEVHAEMTDFIEQKKQEMRQPPPMPGQPNVNGARTQYGQPGGKPFPQGSGRPGSASGNPPGSSSSGAGTGGAGWGAGKGPHPHAHQYNKDESEDFFEKFERFKVRRFYVVCGGFDDRAYTLVSVYFSKTTEVEPPAPVATRSIASAETPAARAAATHTAMAPATAVTEMHPAAAGAGRALVSKAPGGAPTRAAARRATTTTSWSPTTTPVVTMRCTARRRRGRPATTLRWASA
jgi:hypothetical protein